MTSAYNLQNKNSLKQNSVSTTVTETICYYFGEVTRLFSSIYIIVSFTTMQGRLPSPVIGRLSDVFNIILILLTMGTALNIKSKIGRIIVGFKSIKISLNHPTPLRSPTNHGGDVVPTRLLSFLEFGAYLFISMLIILISDTIFYI